MGYLFEGMAVVKPFKPALDKPLDLYFAWSAWAKTVMMRVCM